ncbi:MAG: flagellar basal body L-ring protein FlgH [Lactobacillus sp.]|jgi:flagellar L-ring protein precursor FlgH|nr:flagellar basal body L-ring protein FlgH [Lactobacillus sp.]
MVNGKKITSFVAVLMMATSISGCSSMWQKLQEVPDGPQLSQIENPVEKEDYAPVSLPMPERHASNRAGANSLWKKGSTGFFKDQRAANIGDIITVKVSAKDAAKIENETEAKRDNNTESLSIAKLFGYEEYSKDYLPDGVDSKALVDINSNREISADGKIDRKETISVTMAAVVTQVLPNGNLVIVGTQEIRVNTELRQLSVKGIIRRADISSDNSIESSKIAELRVSYGGRGVISDIQQPRYGSQILDIILPF